MADEEQDATYWIRETQRRGIALEKARRDEAPADQVARLQEEMEEADRRRKATGQQAGQATAGS